jgi:hypothetical protein
MPDCEDNAAVSVVFGGLFEIFGRFLGFTVELDVVEASVK